MCVAGERGFRYPALYLKDLKDTHNSLRNNDVVGFVVEDNTISANSRFSTASGAIVHMMHEGYFMGNTLTSNNCGKGVTTAVSVHGSTGPSPDILAARNNTYDNPACTFELSSAVLYDASEYIDARYSYFGVGIAPQVEAKVFDFTDDSRKGKIVWRAFLGSAGGQVADPWPLSSMVFGAVTTNTVLTGTVHVIGALTLTSSAVVTVAAGSAILADSGVCIQVSGRAQLLARGTSQDPILFDTSQQKSTWCGLVFSSLAAVTFAEFQPFEPSYSGGSVLQWCIVDHAGGGGSDGAVVINAGGPAVINTVITNSARNGVVVENSAHPYTARAVILDSEIRSSARSGILFSGDQGPGRVSHVVARSTLRTNGDAAIKFAKDAFQGSGALFSSLTVHIVGNTITENGHKFSCGGGVTTVYGQALYRPIRIVGNVFADNTAPGYVCGCALALSLGGITTQTSTTYAASISDATIDDGFGTALIEYNTIKGNSAGAHSALLLDDKKCSSTNCGSAAIGFVVRFNNITGNQDNSMTAGAPVVLPDEGIFQHNVVTLSAGGARSAVLVRHQSGPGLHILHMGNNTLHNPQYDRELHVDADFDANEYVDARFSYWGVTNAGAIESRIFHTADRALTRTVVFSSFLSTAPSIDGIGAGAFPLLPTRSSTVSTTAQAEVTTGEAATFDVTPAASPEATTTVASTTTLAATTTTASITTTTTTYIFAAATLLCLRVAFGASANARV